MPLLESCSEPGCAGFAVKKGRCPEHSREHEKDIHKNRTFYHSKRWKRTRLGILRRDGYECQIKGKNCSEFATVVDHIIPVEDAPQLKWDDTNMQSACKSCHNAKTYQEVLGRGDWNPRGK